MQGLGVGGSGGGWAGGSLFRAGQEESCKEGELWLCWEDWSLSKILTGRESLDVEYGEQSQADGAHPAACSVQMSQGRSGRGRDWRNNG